MPFEEVYARLRGAARRERRRLDVGQTLNTTALVHEVYLDLCAKRETAIAPRDFFGYAARPKHGGGLRQTDLSGDAADALHWDAAQALDLDAALRKLSDADPRAAEIVELHYFAGVSLGDIGKLLGVSERTINREWRVARAWLQRELTA